MSAIDTYKYRFFGITCALVSAFVILMILIFSLDPSRYRWHFGIGLLFSIYFVLSNLWVTGFFGPLTKVIPMFLLYHASFILLFISCLVVFYTLHRFYPEYYPTACIRWIVAPMGMALICYIISIFMSSTIIPVILSLGLASLSLLIWLVQAFRTITKTPLDLFLFQTGFLLLIAGATVNITYGMSGIQNFSLYIMPICLGIYVVLTFISTKYSQKQLLEKTMHLMELEKDAARMQAAMLSSQMRPHFLHNALTSVQEMCYTEPEEAANLVVHLSKYLRNNTDFMDLPDLISFSGELDHIRNYMYIQHARYGEALNFEEHLGFTDFKIPPLSVQPLIENAINYGVRKNSNQGTIRLETFIEEDIIHIRVTNSGPGFDPTVQKANHSIQNIRKRLEMYLNGTLIITSHPDRLGTVAEITFRIQHNEEEA